MRTIRAYELDEARNLLDYLLDRAETDDGKPVAICIVDATGRQLVAAAMDGVKEPSIKTAHDKAVTAVKFERDTVAFRHTQTPWGWRSEQDMRQLSKGPSDSKLTYDGWSESDLITADKINPVFVSWAGGVLIKSVDGSILGAVGVSGREELEDHELASARGNALT